ncbi:MAG: flavin reductase family protein [Congregibacter sp.]|nr:flavin reductase family protein [Congregibacter sp.]MDP5071436.1 flavin reductase family protein [Congregibacter sp.]
MFNNRHFYEPGQGHGLAHDPFNSIVAPRPIGWISSRDSAGLLNLAPYSFFNAFNYRPPIIGFSSIGYKDSVRNISETGMFCWSLATRPLAEAMNQTSAMVAADVSEFELAGVTPRESKIIDVPHVAESPVCFECRVTQTIRLTSAQGEALDTHVVFGEVVGVHIEHDLIRDGVYDTIAAHPILRGGGPADYFTISQDAKFTMNRPDHDNKT